VRRRGGSDWAPALKRREPIEKEHSGMLNGIMAIPKPTRKVGDLVRVDKQKWYGTGNGRPEGLGIIKSTNWILCEGGEKYQYVPEAHVVWFDRQETTVHSHDSLEVVNAV